MAIYILRNMRKCHNFDGFLSFCLLSKNLIVYLYNLNILFWLQTITLMPAHYSDFFLHIIQETSFNMKLTSLLNYTLNHTPAPIIKISKFIILLFCSFLFSYYYTSNVRKKNGTWFPLIKKFRFPGRALKNVRRPFFWFQSFLKPIKYLHVTYLHEYHWQRKIIYMLIDL